jgi:hypothetical protein
MERRWQAFVVQTGHHASQDAAALHPPFGSIGRSRQTFERPVRLKVLGYDLKGGMGCVERYVTEERTFSGRSLVDEADGIFRGEIGSIAFLANHFIVMVTV